MKRESLYISIAAYLAILIPTPGRFVFGFALMLEFLLLTFIGILVNSLIKQIKIDETKALTLMMILIATTILYRQIIVLLCPEVALTLGFIIYLPPVSLYIVGYLFNNNDASLPVSLKTKLLYVAKFVCSGLVFFLFRDIAGFGTFTFFGKKHMIYEKVLFSSDSVGIFSFFATIPGALMLSGVVLMFHIILRNRFKTLENAGVV